MTRVHPLILASLVFATLVIVLLLCVGLMAIRVEELHTIHTVQAQMTPGVLVTETYAAQQFWTQIYYQNLTTTPNP